MNRTPLTTAERAALQRVMRYALAIFAVVALALIIVGMGSALLQR